MPGYVACPGGGELRDLRSRCGEPTFVMGRRRSGPPTRPRRTSPPRPSRARPPAPTLTSRARPSRRSLQHRGCLDRDRWHVHARRRQQPELGVGVPGSRPASPTNTGSNVVFINIPAGATAASLACQVTWTLGSAGTLNGSTFVGTVLATSGVSRRLGCHGARTTVQWHVGERHPDRRHHQLRELHRHPRRNDGGRHGRRPRAAAARARARAR